MILIRVQVKGQLFLYTRHCIAKAGTLDGEKRQLVLAQVDQRKAGCTKEALDATPVPSGRHFLSRERLAAA
ncbi:hypothetical protein SDC9_204226 [bioreactor metagenome]|uniref:Uncharacterized protein n=1 Tax=bioreactor metagenome TaxID=1076179 RepID=A0A645IZA8_9ZZZZ